MNVSRVIGNLIAGMLFQISSTGWVEREGDAGNLVCDFGGTRKLASGALLCITRPLSAGDAGDSLINLIGKLGIGHRGAPNLVYFGNPFTGNIRISHDSTLPRKCSTSKAIGN